MTWRHESLPKSDHSTPVAFALAHERISMTANPEQLNSEGTN
jgi:hypothetical protein